MSGSMDDDSSNCRAKGGLHWLLLLIFFMPRYCPFISVIYAAETSKVHIVYMGEKPHEDPAVIRKSHHKMMSSLLGSQEAARTAILYSYKHGFSGFAARLTEAEAEEIAEFPGVVRVFPNRIHKLHTTRSWDFLGLAAHHSGSNYLTESNMGEGAIIGVIDTGVWPESRSFNDEGMGPIPSGWKGVCQQGERFNSSNCNRKLIGARWFVKGLSEQLNGTGNKDFLSPRDRIGHGTHTASTAAGRFVEKASYRGLAAGIARGGAALAGLAIYKACWVGGCSDADILKAFDKAIHDGVHILSVSIGNEIPLFSYLRDSIAVGSFHATSRGIAVVCSGGNDGPLSGTIVNTAPWLITVAAATIDRAFPAPITLGNNRTLHGQSLDVGKYSKGFTGLVYSERIALKFKDDSAEDCQSGRLNATLAAGKVVLCFSKTDALDIGSASAAVAEAGGVALIYAQFRDNQLDSCDIIPCIKVDYEVGTEILSYIRRARSPTVKLSLPKTIIGKLASPRIAFFSSRGPSSMSPFILKPDVAAPGVNILAAYPQENRNGFTLLSGTSMACPHVAGIAALVKSAHPDWSPAAIRSALVTTASQTGTDGMEITEEGSSRKAADPFDIGGGHVNPIKALNPGLIYNVSSEEYIQFLCSMGYNKLSITRLTRTSTNCMKNSQLFSLNLNLPSITIPNLKKRATVQRTVSNVGHPNSMYKALVQAPYGVEMVVEPRILRFNLTNQVLPFKVTFLSKQKIHGGYKFGSLTWTDGEHLVRSPISIRVIQFDSYADI